jgi:hypothetical protein
MQLRPRRSPQPLGRMRTSSQILVLVACVVVATSLAGCAPYLMSFTHLCFEEQAGLEVLARSTASPDTQGNELHRPKVGMPLKLRLSRPSYSIDFDTPLQISPVVFLSARDEHGVTLNISGASVKRVFPGSGAELDGFEFSFYVQEAKGAPLYITIADPTGKVLGTETLRYKIVSRGYAYGIESI